MQVSRSLEPPNRAHGKSGAANLCNRHAERCLSHSGPFGGTSCHHFHALNLSSSGECGPAHAGGMRASDARMHAKAIIW